MEMEMEMVELKEGGLVGGVTPKVSPTVTEEVAKPPRDGQDICFCLCLF
jgi:hypothetical protein